jgi:hypothetical protein
MADVLGRAPDKRLRQPQGLGLSPGLRLLLGEKLLPESAADLSNFDGMLLAGMEDTSLSGPHNLSYSSEPLER